MYTYILRVVTSSQLLTFRSVDLALPWWHTFAQRKASLVWIVGIEAVVGGFITATPVFLAQAFDSKNSNYAVLIFAALLLAYLITWIKDALLARVEAEEMYSLFLAANAVLLTTDPIHHQLRESGKLISKVDNGSQSMEKLYDTVAFGSLKDVVTIGTGLVLFATQSLILGFILVVVLVIALVLIVNESRKIRKQFQSAIDAQDAYENITVEGMTQTPLIRSTFQTKQFLAQEEQLLAAVEEQELQLWHAFDDHSVTVSLLMNVGGVVIILFLLNHVQTGVQTLAQATALFAVYAGIHVRLLGIIHDLQTLFRTKARISDLMKTMSSFGQTSFLSI
jgi:ABC-type multidrug transport system fused ATPase/permease subunit